MSTFDVTNSQRKAAVVAGIAYPVTFVIVVLVNLGLFADLIVHGNAAETAKNILTHETLFRIGIVGDLIYCLGIILVLTGFYVILRPVSQNLALLAAFTRLVYGMAWLSVSLHLFTALGLLTDTHYAGLLSQDQLVALARVYLSNSDAYYVGLLFWALAATIGSYLWYKSGYIPKVLAAFGVVSSAWCIICTLVFYVFPTFADVVNLWWFDSPMVIFELVLSFWLLFRGLRPRRESVEPG